MSDITEKIGFIACLFSILPFIPQIIKIYRSGNAQGISLLTYILLCLGAILWEIYGILIHSIPVIVSNVISFSLEITIIIMKLKNNHNI